VGVLLPLNPSNHAGFRHPDAPFVRNHKKAARTTVVPALTADLGVSTIRASHSVSAALAGALL